VIRQPALVRAPDRARGGPAEPRGFGPLAATAATAAAGHDFARISVSAPVQRQAERDAAPDAIRGAAREGVRAPAAPLPFATRIQRAFGRHAVGGIRAHLGPAAARTTGAMRADAFAHGDHVVFGAAPTLHLAAHEAAHVVQQRAGARPAGGIGRVGDVLERHADAVAARVAAGGTAEALLDRIPGAGAGHSAPAAAPVQRGVDTTMKNQLKRKQEQKKKAKRAPGFARDLKSDRAQLLRPRRPQFRNKDVNQPETPMQQPVATVRKAAPVGYTLPPDVDARVDDVPGMTTPGTPKRIDLDSTRLRQFTKVKLDQMGVKLTGGNQGGRYPEDEAHQHELPEVADYTERRPEQVLSQISEVMLHSAQAAGKEPVETQFGYGRRDDRSPLDLYASTNNKATQELLLEHMKDPVSHVKAAAKNKDNPQLQKMALKLLFFEEHKQARLKEIENHPDREKLTRELEVASQVHDSFMKGNVNVVVNRYDRHAEQNIAEAMHARGGYTSGEIGGSMIRCEGCSSELGHNLEDEEGHALVGRSYASQAESERHQQTYEDIQRGRTRVVTNRSARSRSHSPPRVPKKVEEKKVEEKKAEEQKKDEEPKVVEEARMKDDEPAVEETRMKDAEPKAKEARIEAEDQMKDVDHEEDH